MLDKFGTRLIGNGCTIMLESETSRVPFISEGSSHSFRDLSFPIPHWIGFDLGNDKIYMKHFESENITPTTVPRFRFLLSCSEFGLARVGGTLQCREICCSQCSYHAERTGWNSSDFKSPARLRSEHSLRRKGYLFPAISLLWFFPWF